MSEKFTKMELTREWLDRNFQAYYLQLLFIMLTFLGVGGPRTRGMKLTQVACHFTRIPVGRKSCSLGASIPWEIGRHRPMAAPTRKCAIPGSTARCPRRRRLWRVSSTVGG